MQDHCQQQTHDPLSQGHHANHPHPTFKCYFRTPDMRCKIDSVSADHSLQELKLQVKNTLGLHSTLQPSAIKLIVNEVQLTDDMNLALHLFQNAIIHVILPPRQIFDSQDVPEINIKIKEPPMSSPAYTLENVSQNQGIKKLKQKIITFYQKSDESSNIGSLSENNLYLVYGGRILADDRIVKDYDIDQNGIVYVVNGNIYARQVTKQEAERRIQQVKRGQFTETESELQVNRSSEFPQEESELKDGQELIFNIVQNIVHDEDSDVEGETAHDKSRSQRIIHRYNSIHRPAEDTNNDEDCVVNEDVAERPEKIEEGEEYAFKQQIQENLSNLAETISQKPEVLQSQQPNEESTPNQNEGTENGASEEQVRNSLDDSAPKDSGEVSQEKLDESENKEDLLL